MRVLARVTVWCVGGVWLAIFLATTAPALIGYRTLAVLSGSMQPKLSTGDLIINENISPRDARIGDIVTFREPGETRLITHRVHEVRLKGSQAIFRTRGDANNTTEHWTVSADGHIGRVVAHMPHLGYVTTFVTAGLGRLGLIVLPILCWGIWEVIRIWRPESDPESEVALGAKATPA